MLGNDRQGQTLSECFEFKLLTIDEQQAAISCRDGETRLGQEVLFRNTSEDWKGCRYHILGVREDIGPRANGGFGGADKAFDAFLKRFLAVQSNRFLSGTSIAIHGTINPIHAADKYSLSEQVVKLDEAIVLWATEVMLSGGIPIVIGGGHNNAFGLIKASYNVAGQKVNIVNLDPHADTRETNGRHSGNPFSYAWKDGFLEHYTVLGLHQGYNNSYILEQLDSMGARATYFEDWLDRPDQFPEDLETTLASNKDKPTGIELDMDAIAGMPSSAYTPSGITLEQARIYVRKMSSGLQRPLYLHLPEAAPKNETDAILVGKSLSYLVTDFIKSAETVKKKW